MKKKKHIIITYKSQNILTNFFLIKFSPKILIKGNLYFTSLYLLIFAKPMKIIIYLLY